MTTPDDLHAAPGPDVTVPNPTIASHPMASHGTVTVARTMPIAMIDGFDR
jgi:hypothetical protein